MFEDIKLIIDLYEPDIFKIMVCKVRNLNGSSAHAALDLSSWPVLYTRFNIVHVYIEFCYITSF